MMNPSNPSAAAAAAAAAPAKKQKRKQTSKVLMRRRIKCVKKKASELSTLCGIDIGMICYMPDDVVGGANNAQTWPEDPSRVRDIVQRFEGARSSGNLKKISGIKDFIGKKAKPGAGPASDHDRSGSQKEEMSWCEELDQLSEEELRAFACHLEKVELRVLEEEKKHQLNAAESNVVDYSVGSASNRVIPTLIEFDILKR